MPRRLSYGTKLGSKVRGKTIRLALPEYSAYSGDAAVLPIVAINRKDLRTTASCYASAATDLVVYTPQTHLLSTVGADPVRSTVVAHNRFDTTLTSLTGETWTASGGAISTTPTGNLFALIGTNSHVAVGPGSNVSTPHTAALALHSGAPSALMDDFTIEMWLYLGAVSASNSQIAGKTDGTSVDWKIYQYANNFVGFQFGDVNVINQGMFAFSANVGVSFAHIALVVIGETIYGYKDGVLVGTRVRVAGEDGPISTAGTNLPLVLGPVGTLTTAVSTRIADFRISKYARYTGNFTPPAAYLGIHTGNATAAASADLFSGYLTPAELYTEYGDPFFASLNSLLHFSEANNSTTGFVDSAGGTPTTDWWISAGTGSTQTVTRGMGAFGLDNSYLQLRFGDAAQPITPYAMSYGGGNLTIELWINRNNNNAVLGQFFGIIDLNSTQSFRLTTSAATSSANAAVNFAVQGDDAGGTLTLNPTTISTSVANGIPASGWTHIAAVKNGSSLTLYINGVSRATGTNTDSYVASVNARPSLSSDAPSGQGYTLFDELRITSAARYTAGFTLQTAQYPAAAFSRMTVAVATATAALTTGVVAGASLNCFPLASSTVTAALSVVETLHYLDTKVVVDPYFANVASLLHFDDGNNTSTFTDVTGKVWSLTDPGFAVNKNDIMLDGVSSGRFDGSLLGKLSTPYSTDFSFGSGDFTIEFWLYIPAAAPTQTRPILYFGSSATYSLAVFYNGVAGGGGDRAELRLRDTTNAVSGSSIGGAGMATVLRDRWTHIAIVRTGNTVKMASDGVFSWTATYGTGLTLMDTTEPITLASVDNNYTLNGRLDELRITKGVGRYTSNFTPVYRHPDSMMGVAPGGAVATAALTVITPATLASTPAALATATAAVANNARLAAAPAGVATGTAETTIVSSGPQPLAATPQALATTTAAIQNTVLMTTGVTADPYYNNTSLLLHGNGANGSTTFTDNSPTPKALTAVGNAQISTAQSVFGGASIAFDGTGDRITAPSSTDYEFGTGDFTIELAWRPTSATVDSALITYAELGTIAGGAQLGFGLHHFGASIAGKVRAFFYNGVNGYTLDSTTALVAGTWYRIAYTRQAGVTRLFINGVQEATATQALALNVPTVRSLFLGYYTSTATREANGWMDEVRITKGVARYTANYTVDAAEFPNSALTPSGSASAVSTATAALTNLAQGIAALGANAAGVSATTAALSLNVRLASTAQGAASSGVTGYTTTLSVGGDPYWSNVKALLHLDGASGSTTYRDELGNTFTGTATGLTTVQSRFGGSSFKPANSASENIQGPLSADFNVNTSDFTLECWIYTTTSLSDVPEHEVVSIVESSGAIVASLGHNGFGLTLRYYDGAGPHTVGFSLPGYISPGGWTPIQLIRSGSTLTPYIGGRVPSGGAQTISGNLGTGQPTSKLVIGTMSGGGVAPAYYVDEVRFTNGVVRDVTNLYYPLSTPFPNGPGGGAPAGAVSTATASLLIGQALSNITPYDPLFASVTSLLHFEAPLDGTVFTDVTGLVWAKDAPSNVKILGPGVSPFSIGCFATYGGYISTPPSTAFNLTGDFTIEMWQKSNPTAFTAASDLNYGSCRQAALMSNYLDSATANKGWEIRLIQLSAGNGFKWDLISLYTGTVYLDFPCLINQDSGTNIWSHIAISRSGSSIRAFVDGVQVGPTRTNSELFSADTDVSRPMFLGANNGITVNKLGGYIDEVRVTKAARYTAGFSVQTANFPDQLTPTYATAVADVLVQVRLATSATSAATVTAGLSTVSFASLAASTAALSTATAAVAVNVRLAAAPAAVALSATTLSGATNHLAAATAVGVATTTAALAQNTKLAAASAAVASSPTADLIIGAAKPLGTTAAAVAAATPALASGKPLGTSTVAQGTASANVFITKALATAAAVQASVITTITLGQFMAAAAAVTSTASGALTSAVQNPDPRRGYIVDPEARTTLVGSEVRGLIVTAENRTLVTTGETRALLTTV